MKYNTFLIFALIFCFACKKEKVAVKTIGSIDISDARMLIYGSVDIDIYAHENPADSVDLYKVTVADEINPVAFYNPDGAPLNNLYVVDGIYKLDTSYFLLNTYLAEDKFQNIESYIIKKQTGKAFKLSKKLIPNIYKDGNWVKGAPEVGFKSRVYHSFILNDETSLIKLKINELDMGLFEATIENLGTQKPVFAVNSSEDVLTENGILFSSGEFLNISEATGYNYISGTNSNYFKIGKLINDTLWVYKLTAQNQNYNTELFDTVKISTNTLNYLGSAILKNISGETWVFSDKVIYLSVDSARKIEFSTIGLKSVSNYYLTDNDLYLLGFNILNYQVILKLLPNTKPLIYSTLFAPDAFEFYNFNFESDGRYCYYGYKKNVARNVFGYRMSNSQSSIVVNDRDIKVRQILSLK